MERNKYKLLPIALGMALFLSACGGKDENKDNSTNPEATTKNINQAPSNVKLMEVSSTSTGDITASWLPATDDKTPASELVYELHASNEKDFTPSKQTQIFVGKNVNTAKVEDKLTGGKTYYIRLVVVDASGEKTASDTLSVNIANRDAVNNVSASNGYNYSSNTNGSYVTAPQARKVVEIPQNTVSTITKDSVILPADTPVPNTGGFIVSTKQGGSYLRKVVSSSIDPATGKKVVKTTPAAVSEVVSQAEISSAFRMSTLPEEVPQGLQTGLVSTENNSVLDWKSTGYQYSAGQTSSNNSQSQLQLGLKQSETNLEGGGSTVLKKAISASFPRSITLTRNSNQSFNVSAIRLANTDAVICNIKPLRVEAIGQGTNAGTITFNSSGALSVKQKSNDNKAILKASQGFNVKVSDTSPLGAKYNLVVAVNADQQNDNCQGTFNLWNYSGEVRIPIKVVPDDVLPKNEKTKLEKKQSPSFFTVSGDVTSTFDPVIEFDKRIDVISSVWGKGLKYARLVAKADANIKQTLTIETRDANSKIDQQYDLIKPRKFYKVYQAGYVPVVISGEMTLKMHVTGNATGKLKATETLNLGYENMEYGFEYTNPGGYKAIEKATPNHYFTVHGEGGAEANLKVALVPSIKVTAYEVISSRAVAEPYLKAGAGIEGYVDYVAGKAPDAYLGKGFDADYRLTKAYMSGGLNAYFAADFHLWDKQLVAYPKNANLNDVTAYNKAEGAGGYKKIEIIKETKFLGLPELPKPVVNFNKTNKDSRVILVQGKVTNVPFPFGDKKPLLPWLSWTAPRVINTQSTSQDAKVVLDSQDKSKAWFTPKQVGTYTVRLGGYSNLGSWARQYQDVTVTITDSNKNSIPDYWEKRFGVMGKDINSDADKDRLTLLQEWQQGKNPTVADNEACPKGTTYIGQEAFCQLNEMPTLNLPSTAVANKTVNAKLSGKLDLVHSIEWLMGDGTSKKVTRTNGRLSPLFNHIYKKVGNYTATARVYDAKGLFVGKVSDKKITVVADTATPTLTYNLPSTATVGKPYNYSITQSNGDKTCYKQYNIDWGDGYKPNATASKCFDMTKLSKHTYTKAGTYKITFKFTTDTGKTVTKTQTVTVKASSSKLTATGITKCGDYAYGNGSRTHNNDLDCSLTKDADGDPIPAGQDGHIQAGEPMKYSKVNGGECIKDEVTGLIWEQKVDDASSIRHKSHTYTWYNTDATTNGGSAGSEGSNSCGGLLNSKCNTQAYIDKLNADNYCGYSDWRLPTYEELTSIVDYGRYRPAINPVFTNTQNSYYRSSSPSVTNTNNALGVVFYYGYVSHRNNSNGYYVRAVRSE